MKQKKMKRELGDRLEILNYFLLSYLMFSEERNLSHISLYLHWEAMFLRLIVSQHIINVAPA